MKKCNPYFYVPNIRDLENTHKSCNNFNDDNCNETSTRNCSNYPVNNDFLEMFMNYYFNWGTIGGFSIGLLRWYNDKPLLY